MYYETVVWIIAAILLFITSIIDLKTREVPDWISYGSIFLGLFISAVESIMLKSPWYIINSVTGLVVFGVIAFGMYYLGQWGGGDSKILMSLGAMLGIPLKEVLKLKLPMITNFLALIVVIGAFYGLFYSIIIVLKNKDKFVKNFRETLDKYSLIRKILLLCGIILMIASIFTPWLIRIALLALVFATISSFYIWIYAKSIEKGIMTKKIKPEKLTIGDWIADEVKIDGKVIARPSELGVSKEELEKIIKASKDNKLEYVIVKEGIPFLPSFFMAFIIYLLMIANQINIFSLL